VNLHELLPYLPAGIFFVWLLVNARLAANKLRNRETRLRAAINDLQLELTQSRESEARNRRALFDSFPTCMLIVDPNDDRIRLANSNADTSKFEVGKAVTNTSPPPIDRSIRSPRFFRPGTRSCTVRLAKGGGHALIRSAVAAVPMADSRFRRMIGSSRSPCYLPPKRLHRDARKSR